MSQTVILLSGKKGSGKDTLAELLRPDFARIAFADAIYSQVREAFNLYDEEILRDRSTKELPQEELGLYNCNDLDFIGVALDNGLDLGEDQSPRTILQLWGTEYVQNKFGKDYWVQLVIEAMRADPSTDFVIPDLRFPHEINLINDYVSEVGGRLLSFRIVRENTVYDTRSQHPSETALDSYECFDGFITNEENNPGTMLSQVEPYL